MESVADQNHRQVIRKAVPSSDNRKTVQINILIGIKSMCEIAHNIIWSKTY